MFAQSIPHGAGFGLDVALEWITGNEQADNDEWRNRP